MSGETRFTPGPWLADLHNERRDGGRFYAYIRKAGEAVPIGAVPSGVEGFGREQGRANAHLIAAAPDLYEALKAALPRLAHPVKCRVRPSAEWAEHGSASFEDCSCEISMVRAALARARGEQP